MEHVLHSHKNCDSKSFITKKSTLFVFGHDVLIWQKLQWDASMRRRGYKKGRKKIKNKVNWKRTPFSPQKSQYSLQRERTSISQSSQSWVWAMVVFTKKNLQHSLVITCFTHQNIKLSGERKTSFYLLLSINMYRCISPSTLQKKKKRGEKEERAKKGPIQIKTTEKKVEKEEQKCMCSRFSHRVFHHRHFGWTCCHPFYKGVGGWGGGEEADWNRKGEVRGKVKGSSQSSVEHAWFICWDHVLDIDKGVISSVAFKAFQRLLNQVPNIFSLLLAVVDAVPRVHCHKRKTERHIFVC